MRVIFTGKQTALERLFYNAMARHGNRKQKKKIKDKELQGEYCPKRKAGQSWAYTKESRDVETSNIEDE